jgi:hypothetical protein
VVLCECDDYEDDDFDDCYVVVIIIIIVTIGFMIDSCNNCCGLFKCPRPLPLTVMMWYSKQRNVFLWLGVGTVPVWLLDDFVTGVRRTGLLNSLFFVCAIAPRRRKIHCRLCLSACTAHHSGSCGLLRCR